MSGFYQIDQSTKSMKSLQLTKMPSFLFACDFDAMCDRLGSSRIVVDAMHHISKHLCGTPPVVIDIDHLHHFAKSNPQTPIIPISRDASHNKKQKIRNIYTVLLDPHSLMQATNSDTLVLTHGVFNPTQVPFSSQTIFSDTLPSRAQFMKKGHTLCSASKVLVYFREPHNLNRWNENDYERHLYFDLLNLQKGCDFELLISNSTRSPCSRLKELANKKPSNQFCDIFVPSHNDSGWWEQALNEATVAIVTDDTISSLSDCLAAGIPTYLYTHPQNAPYLLNPKSDASCALSGGNNDDFCVQRNLINKGKLKIFSSEEFSKPWVPKLQPEWDNIGAKIAQKIKAWRASL